MKKNPILIDLFMAILLSVSIYMFTYTGIIGSLHPALYAILTPIVFFMLKRKREKEQRDRSDK